MKPDKHENINLVRSEVWLDTDSYRSMEKIFGNNAPPMEEDIALDGSGEFEEEEKGDVYWNYIEAIKNQNELDVLKVLNDYKSEIGFKDIDIFVYLLVLFEKGTHYEKVKEFLEENI